MDGRRSFLVVAGSALLAGCVSLGDGGSGDDGSGGDGSGDGGTEPDDGGTDDPGGSTTDGEDPTATGATTAATTAGTSRPATTASPTTTTATAAPAGTPERIVSRTTRVMENDWSQYSWGQSTEATLVYEFAVTDGPAIDAMVMHFGQFRLYRQGQSAEYVERASAVDSTGDRVRATLPSTEDRYVLLFDNTYFGPSGPPRNAIADTAVVEVDATVYRP